MKHYKLSFQGKNYDLNSLDFEEFVLNRLKLNSFQVFELLTKKECPCGNSIIKIDDSINSGSLMVGLNLKKPALNSFQFKHYDLLVKGILKDKSLIEMNDDFDVILERAGMSSFNFELSSIKNPDFDFHQFAQKHPKSTMFLEFRHSYQMEDNYDFYRVLIHKGQAFECNLSFHEFDISSLS